MGGWCLQCPLIDQRGSHSCVYGAWSIDTRRQVGKEKKKTVTIKKNFRFKPLTPPAFAEKPPHVSKLVHGSWCTLQDKIRTHLTAWAYSLESHWSHVTLRNRQDKTHHSEMQNFDCKLMGKVSPIMHSSLYLHLSTHITCSQCPHVHCRFHRPHVQPPIQKPSRPARKLNNVIFLVAVLQ